MGIDYFASDEQRLALQRMWLESQSGETDKHMTIESSLTLEDAKGALGYIVSVVRGSLRLLPSSLGTCRNVFKNAWGGDPIYQPRKPKNH